MKFGIADLSIIPVRAEAKEQSEMVTQILFGETFEIHSIRKNWCHIKITNDGYIGWINKALCKIITEKSYNKHLSNKPIITNELITIVHKSDRKVPIFLVTGSSIPFLNAKNKFTISNTEYTLIGEINNDYQDKREALVLNAKKFLNSPYLWGGKTHFGIDCSGFTQNIFNIIGNKIPRDARLQVELGKNIDFINDAKPGDLAFFDNEEGEIIHVGLVLENGKIIHASGKVRIDTLDHQGIYNSEIKSYTHKLRVIKQII